MPDHDDLIGRLQDKLDNPRGRIWVPIHREVLTEAINRLSGERITLWRCPKHGLTESGIPVLDYLICLGCGERLEGPVPALLPEGERP